MPSAARCPLALRMRVLVARVEQPQLAGLRAVCAAARLSKARLRRTLEAVQGSLHGERWRGEGTDEADALDDALTQALPSHLGWQLLRWAVPDLQRDDGAPAALPGAL